MFAGAHNSRMVGKKREKVRDEDVTGLKYFDKLQPLLKRLHDVGCRRDKAGNRKLHVDEYCLRVVLFLFNPVVRSLRAIQQASELPKVQRKLGCLRASLGSLSEATDVFDPERLKQNHRRTGRATSARCQRSTTERLAARHHARRRHAFEGSARAGSGGTRRFAGGEGQSQVAFAYAVRSAARRAGSHRPDGRKCGREPTR